MIGYHSLANAIIEQAAQDYRNALKSLRRHPDSKAAMEEALKIEEFFHSGLYAALTEVDPDYLINRLRKEASK